MLRVGVVLFCVTALALAGYLLWAGTRVAIPLDATWPKGTDHWRTAEFTPNVSTGYDVEVWYRVRLPQATQDCLARWWDSRGRPADCGEPLPSVPTVTVVPTHGGAPSALLNATPLGETFDERNYFPATNEYTLTL
jgi:hypothetical protein